MVFTQKGSESGLIIILVESSLFPCLFPPKDLLHLCVCVCVFLFKAQIDKTEFTKKSTFHPLATCGPGVPAPSPPPLTAPQIAVLPSQL